MKPDLLFDNTEFKMKKNKVRFVLYSDFKKARLEQIKVTLLFNLILWGFWTGAFIIALIEG